MKKITFFSLLVFAAVTLFTACNSQPQLHNVRGLVKYYVETSDSVLLSDSSALPIPDMVLGVNENDTMLFSMKDVRLQNGVSIPGDSVIVDYIKGEDGFIALVVTRLDVLNNKNIVNGDTLKHALDRQK